MQPDEPEESEIPLDRVVVQRRVRERPFGNSENLQSSRCRVLGHSFDRRCFVGVQCRALENDLECSFHVHTRSADILVHEGHALAQRIEGQLAHETLSLEQDSTSEAALASRERERDVDRIACPSHLSVLIQQASGRGQRRCGESSCSSLSAAGNGLARRSRFSVSVPVLSEAMTVVLPSVSTAVNRRRSHPARPSRERPARGLW